jgi:AcrR family transcriptional regulator
MNYGSVNELQFTSSVAYRKTRRVDERLADNRILAAARSLVSEGRWGKAQISNVASLADIATGSVYRCFPSKADLFVEGLSVVSQREVDVLLAIEDNDEPPYQSLHAAISTFVERAMRNRRLAYALIAEPCEKQIDEARLTNRSAVSNEIMRIVKEGQNTDAFRVDVDPSIAATVIVGGFINSLIGPLSALNTDSSGPIPRRPYPAEPMRMCAARRWRTKVTLLNARQGRLK